MFRIDWSISGVSVEKIRRASVLAFNKIIMIPDTFVGSYDSHKKGDKGFCKLASVSSKKNNIIYDIGFWFEIIRSNGSVLTLSVQSCPCKKAYKNMVFIDEKSQLEVFIEDLRLQMQDELSSFLPCPDDDNKNIEIESGRHKICLCKELTT